MNNYPDLSGQRANLFPGALLAVFSAALLGHGNTHAQTRLDTPACKLVLADNSASAKATYQKKADAGDVCAQFNLGYFFYLNQNFEAARWWYGEAASRGNSKAQFELAMLYRDGVGTAKNPVKAAQWIQKSAAQGESAAQLELGVIYDLGEGLKKDQDKAVYWYTQAAQQGNDTAQYNLGLMYRTDLGDGVEQADSGSPGHSRDDVKALQWFCKAAAQGYAPAQFQVGDAYRQARGVEVDYAQTRLWYRKAAAQGYDKAVSWLDNDLSGPWYYVAEKWVKLQMLRFKTAKCPA